MNTQVNFETKQLLFKKGWRYELDLDETGHRVTNSLAKKRWNEGNLTYVDITISDVVMWLYEKHGIWISINREPESGVFYYSIDKNKGDFFYDKGDDFNSPTEAYEAAIKYCLDVLV